MFSCIMPVRFTQISHKEVGWLKQAIDSVLAQEGQHELIIVDDASVVPLQQIFESFSDLPKNVRIFRFENNIGLIRSLNFGLAKSSGEFICRLDADDYWLSHQKSVDQERLMSSDDRLGLVFGSMEVATSDDRVERHNRSFTHGEAVMFAAGRYCPIPHGTVMIKTKALRSIGGYQYRPDSLHVEDFSTWEIFSRFFGIFGMPQMLLRYRQHGKSVSAQNSEMQSAHSRMIQHRFEQHMPWDDQCKAVDEIAEYLSCSFLDAGCWLAEVWRMGGIIPVKRSSLKLMQGLFFDRVLMPTQNSEEYAVELW